MLELIYWFYDDMFFFFVSIYLHDIDQKEFGSLISREISGSKLDVNYTVKSSFFLNFT